MKIFKTDISHISGFTAGIFIGMLPGSAALLFFELGVDAGTAASFLGSVVGAVLSVVGAILVLRLQQRHMQRSPASVLWVAATKLKRRIDDAWTYLDLIDDLHDADDTEWEYHASEIGDLLELLDKEAMSVAREVLGGYEQADLLRDALQAASKAAAPANGLLKQSPAIRSKFFFESIEKAREHAQELVTVADAAR